MHVFYRPEQNVRIPESFSRSPEKPELVVADWLRHFGDRIELCSFEPVAVQDWKQVHAAEYVDAVWNCERDNGFGTRSRGVNDSLRYTSGSMVAAALYAWVTRASTVSPTSGFHHACHARGGGFCTFNGLCLAAHTLITHGARRIGILDCDQHFGDGTEDIILACGMNPVAHWSVANGRGRGEEAFLHELDAQLTTRFADCDVILYQAGADCHVEDPMGGWMSTEGMAERDCQVFAFCRAQRIPVCWNLAGGYQEPLERVIALHRNTMREFLASGLSGA
ncbi:MAG: hypothetical protein CALGDGBN_00292 [Pseudomonadales bacterium]|nr:hypothetical protein [Pseudomonadales bacterium]